jgi:hypothetical protein
MTKFNKGDIVLNSSSLINYNLLNLKIYASNIKTTGPTVDGNYHISYDPTNGSSSNEYNVLYHNDPNNPSNVNYKLTDIWLFKPLHKNIEGTTDGSKDALKNLVGEIVFETASSADSSKKLFLCFLIQSVPNKGTDDPISGSISKLFNNIIKDQINDGGILYASKDNKGTTTINPSSDGTIPSQDDVGSIIYYDSVNNATVVVYLNPITTSNKQFINFISGTAISGASSSGTVKGTANRPILFNIYPPESAGSSVKIINGDAVGKTPLNRLSSQVASSLSSLVAPQAESNDSQIYIDCNPTTDLNGDQELSYNIPLNSTLMQDIQNSSVAQLSSNFLFFGVVVFAIYLGVPRFYNMAICDKMNDKDRKSAKVFIMMYLFILCIALFMDGQNNGNMTELLAGSAIIFFSIFTYLLISNEERRNNVSGEFNAPHYIEFLGGVTRHILNIKTTLPMIFVLWIILMVILVCLAFIPNLNGPGNNGAIITMDKFRDYFCWIGILVIPTVVGTLTWITQPTETASTS